MQQETRPLLLQYRCSSAAGEALLQLSLTAAERQICRGLRRCSGGQEVMLQLPRGEALVPGQLLGAVENMPLVVVVAADEPLLVVCSNDPLALLQAAYHLGNRHVALELQADQLRLLADPVLEHLLAHRGLQVAHLHAPFLPEAGAYGASHNHP
jgi:urease accessory protein